MCPVLLQYVARTGNGSRAETPDTDGGAPTTIRELLSWGGDGG